MCKLCKLLVCLLCNFCIFNNCSRLWVSFCMNDVWYGKHIKYLLLCTVKCDVVNVQPFFEFSDEIIK